MHTLALEDTIAAISTAPGESGIGIVRLSGREALKIADKIFLAKDKRCPADLPSHSLHYGWVVKGLQRKANGQQEEAALPQQESIDEVLLTVMRAPRSYTKEDVVEINCHGGALAMRRVLELVLENGARLAEPGEFTKRAFLNGRIDLAQAEAVLDIIQAKSEAALKVGLSQLKGSLSAALGRIRQELLGVLSALEAEIDFPEEETGAADLSQLRLRLSRAAKQIEALLEHSRLGSLLREGLQVVICGRANVGKSSLLNTLLRKERSIVTDIPGTTRDTIEESIVIRGLPVRIVDTAGIAHPRDLIERKALQRSRRLMREADLILLLFDGSEPLNHADKALLRKLRKKTVIAVINKIDLRQKIEKEYFARRFPSLIEISARQASNIDLLEDKIAGLFFSGRLCPAEPIMVSNLRHIRALRQLQKLVAGSLNSLDNKLSAEFIAHDLKEALGLLDELLGKKFSAELLEQVFRNFCIGK